MKCVNGTSVSVERPTNHLLFKSSLKILFFSLHLTVGLIHNPEIISHMLFWMSQPGTPITFFTQLFEVSFFFFLLIFFIICFLIYIQVSMWCNNDFRNRFLNAPYPFSHPPSHNLSSNPLFVLYLRVDYLRICEATLLLMTYNFKFAIHWCSTLHVFYLSTMVFTEKGLVTWKERGA